MNISIGILAYNEANLIKKMLNSLFEQSLFQEYQPNLKIEIIVIPNGCSDDTAIVAQETLSNLWQQSGATNIDFQVCEIKQAGKANAWNVFVHQLSNPVADYIFLMDADIELIDRLTLSSAIDVLQTMPQAQVSVDRPIKNIRLKKQKNLMERFSTLISSLSGSQTTENSIAWICGQFYCARAEILRQIWLPTNLLNEDGFLYSAIVTDLWRSPANPERVILASQASHSFEAYTNVYSLLRHETSQICGNAVNELLYEDLLTNRQHQTNIGDLIKQRNEQNYMWLNELIKTKIANKGWWLIPKFILIRRFLSLMHQPIAKSILLLPLALLAFAVDLLIAVQANWELRQGKGLAYWGK